MADLSEDMLMDALSKAAQGVLQRRKQEYEMWSNGRLVIPNRKYCMYVKRQCIFSWRN